MASRFGNHPGSLRVGIVDYLNSRPLAWSFRRPPAPSGVPPLEPVYLPPSGVAEGLASGDLDIGLVPSIEVRRIPGLRVIPGLCVAATREVRSVLLVRRGPVEEIRSVALDENSRTSAALVRILLGRRYGLEPSYRQAPPEVEAMLEEADAALVIGDPALAVDRTRHQVSDLAAEWRAWTGLPFVFAVWAVAPGVEFRPGLADFFSESLDRAERDMEDLVREAAVELGLPGEALAAYLTENLSFRLGEPELAGLRLYHRRAAEMGLVPEPGPLRFWDGCPESDEAVE